MLLPKIISWSCGKIVSLSCVIFWCCGASPLQAKDVEEITLHLAPAESSPKGKNGEMILTATSTKPRPLRINFWTGTWCLLENANGKELKWTGAGSDSFRIPPPPEAIPSLNDSGSVTLSMSVRLITSGKETRTEPTLVVTTEWGFSWWLSPLPREGVYLRAHVKGSLRAAPENFYYVVAVKGIGKEGCAQIYEGLLESNRVWISLDTEGDLLIRKPGRYGLPRTGNSPVQINGSR